MDKIKIYNEGGIINIEGMELAIEVREFFANLYSKYDESDLDWLIKSAIELVK